MEFWIGLAYEAGKWLAGAAGGASVGYWVTEKLKARRDAKKEKDAEKVARDIRVPLQGVPAGQFPIDGEWSYEVVDTSNPYHHKGICTFTKNAAGSIAISGTRTYTEEGGVGRKIQAAWSSVWSEVCLDGKVRGEYTIALDDTVVMGYFCLTNFQVSSDGGADVMSGPYFWLAPERKFGHITYTRRIKPQS